MKKIILISFLVLVAVVGAGLYYVFANLDALVKAAIEKAGARATQTAVRVDKVNISLREGTGTISGVSIANPTGFDTRHAFRLDAVETQIDIGSLTKEPFIIERIVVRKPQVFYEMNQEREGNLNTLYSRIASAAAGRSGADQTATIGTEPRLLIRRFVFADATVEATVAPLDDKKYTLTLPPIELQNLGGQTGATPSEISQQVLRIITERALAEVKRAGIDEKAQALKSEAQQKLDTKRREVEGQAEEALKNLLGK